MGSFDFKDAKSAKEAKDLKRIKLATQLMAGTAKFAGGKGMKAAVLKALGMKKGGAVKKIKSIMLKGRGGSFKGVR